MSRIVAAVYDSVMFPGIIAQEVGHVLGCKVTGTEVTNFKLLNFADDEKPAGYVDTGERSSFDKLAIGLSGHILPLILAISIFLLFFTVASSLVEMAFLFWLGYSLLTHSIPMKRELKNMGVLS